MKTDEFKNFTRIRDGVEKLSSDIRNNYDIDRMTRGKKRVSLFFGFKKGALIFMKLLNFRKIRGKYVTKPLLAGAES